MAGLQATVGTALLAFAAAALPVATLAQSTSTGAPSYARPAPGEETIHGSIVSLDGAGNLQLRDDRGFVDNVRLEPNVDVTPAGVQLQPGARVTIVGANAGSYFAAERVDAGQPAVATAPPAAAAPPLATDPYAYPYPVYPYPVVAYPVYPYPVYGYPYPTFSIGIGIGFGFHGYFGGFRR